ncbi:SDR family oxidoreductase [Arthrobacter sp. R1-13]
MLPSGSCSSSTFEFSRAALTELISWRSASRSAYLRSRYREHPCTVEDFSKAAVVAFTKNLARDYAQYNVRVNAVAPGEVRTPMLEAGLARSGRTVADLDVLVPFGRIGKPEEVAALVAFLASDEAPYICGSVVEITGAQAVA